MIANFEQPDHLLDDANSAASKLGIDRAQKGSYLFRSLLASNVQLAFGSDWPVSIMTPIQINEYYAYGTLDIFLKLHSNK